ncbi:hypothetical protein [Avrilella dinanensis]|uniref:hypothetical protein n=1 Tax=Avrilella dinanensis TaxID=2008672 RepID=UPI00240926F1|nr:hypothetical protein [Avrilella dinanensis]
MNVSKVLAVLCLMLAFTSCNKEEEKPKVSYENQPEEEAIYQKIDSTDVKIADLPVHLPGTDFLLHPVGDVRVYSSNSTRYGSSKSGKSYSFAVSNYSYPEITGYMSNLLIQHKDSANLHLLSDNRMLIKSIVYLDKLTEKTNKKVLVYQVVDRDTNRDGNYDSNDILALYISTIDGKNFTKLTDEYQELIDFNVIETQKRLYFRSVEDKNKNGAFDNNDKLNYYYVDLLSEDWKKTPYQPVD